MKDCMGKLCMLEWVYVCSHKKDEDVVKPRC